VGSLLDVFHYPKLSKKKTKKKKEEEFFDKSTRKYSAEHRPSIFDDLSH
jgi:hypothetical protein